MYYIEWDLVHEIDGWSELKLKRLLTEVNQEGEVMKEIGINKDGKVVHAFPDENYKFGEYGMWDNVKIQSQYLRNDLSKREFYLLWTKK